MILISNSVISQSITTGVWRGIIHYEEQNVPFHFEVKQSDQLYIEIINGKGRKRVDDVRREKDSLFIKLTPFDAELKVKYTTNSMSGEWRKHYRNSAVPFTATYDKERFDDGEQQPTEVSKKWKMTFNPTAGLAYPAVGLWEQNGSRMTGTVMTGVSDFRYFEGVIVGDSIKASSFDGAHAFLLLGKKEGKQWKGTFYFDNSYSEDWEAQANDNASLPDPWTVVEVNEGEHRPFFDILSAGEDYTIDESKYSDKVLVIQLFGTWCPNSLDETNYLIDWYRKNDALDVEVLAVSYEANYSQEYGMQRIEEYKEALNIPYDIVLGGRLSKGQAAVAFPFMDKIEAFPTLVIVDKFGFVRYVHSYFNGPATGSYYDDFDKRFNAIIKELITE